MAETEQPFRMLAAIVGLETSDGRVFDALRFREFPLTVWAQLTNSPGHEDAVIAGRADFAVEDGDERWVYGMLDAVGEPGRETIRLIEGQFLRGVSVDAAGVMVDETEDGTRHFDAEVGAITIVGFPAFRETQIELIDRATYDEAAAGQHMMVEAGDEEAEAGVRGDDGLGLGLVASARPVFPSRYFTPPPFTRREGIHVDGEHVYGHVYGWGECHTGSPRGSCIKPPRSQTAYAHFLTGDVLTDAGEVPVGQVVISTDHAPMTLGWRQATDHYAHTGLVVADVTCGEDAYGIWISGMIRPDASPEVLHAFHAAKKISGDWRPIGGNLELVSILTVNVEGYPPNRAYYAGDRVLALVASSPMHAADCGCGGTSALDEVLERMAVLEELLAPQREHLRREQAEAIAEMEAELGLDRASQIAELEASLG